MRTEQCTWISLTIYLIVILPGYHGVVRDVVYIIDRSGSVRQTDFDEAIVFVYNVTKWLTIGPNDVQVSIVTYSSSTSLHFDLDTYSTNNTLLQRINALKGTTTGGGTATYDALDYVRQNSFLVTNGGRTNALRSVIVMTDGVSNSKSLTIAAAEKVRNDARAEVFSIGVGSAVSTSNDELRGIASDPDSYYVLYVNTYVYLCNLVPALVPKLDSNITNVLMNDCPAPPTTIGSYTTTVTDSTTVIVTTTITDTTMRSDIPTERYSATDTSDNTAILAGAVVSTLCVVGLASVIGAALVKRILFPSEDKAILAAVQQYNPAPLGQKKSSFSYAFNVDI